MTIDEKAFQAAYNKHSGMTFSDSNEACRELVRLYEQAKKPDTTMVQKLVEAVKFTANRHPDGNPIFAIEKCKQTLTEAEAWLKTNKQEIE